MSLSIPESARTRSWRTLLIFNGYRLVQMPLMAIMTLMTTNVSQNISSRGMVYFVGSTHALLIAVGLMFSWRWRRQFNLQVTAQVLIDIVCIGLLLFVAGGLKSGFGSVLLISIAGASMVAKLRLALFYAALASIVIISVEFLGDYLFFPSRHHELENIAQGAFLSMGFFAVALGAHFLGNRLIVNEDLARQRGIELDNQIRIRRRVMEQMKDGVLVVDVEGRIRNCNPMALAILGSNPDREEGDLARIEPELARRYRIWREHGGSNRLELHRPESRDIAVRFVRTYSSDGAALVFLEDLSGLRNQAMQLKLAALGRLTASIAHEIRNPLSAISHATDLLSEELEDSVQKRLLRIIRDNSDRLEKVIQDILVLGRQRAAAQEVIALAPYITEFVRETRMQEELGAQVISVKIPETAQLYFEPGQLRQILWNLVMNALRYASRNPGAVRLEVRQREEGMELHIIDDGPGIPKELLEQIFEPFFSTATKGTGLGLYIARELCEANNAHLFAVDDETGGHFILKGKGEAWQQEMNDESEAP
jgi:two-component system sensor histidine kinase PilS (NtrC family)